MCENSNLILLITRYMRMELRKDCSDQNISDLCTMWTDQPPDLGGPNLRHNIRTFLGKTPCKFGIKQLNPSRGNFQYSLLHFENNNRLRLSICSISKGQGQSRVIHSLYTRFYPRCLEKLKQTNNCNAKGLFLFVDEQEQSHSYIYSCSYVMLIHLRPIHLRPLFRSLRTFISGGNEIQKFGSIATLLYPQTMKK